MRGQLTTPAEVYAQQHNEVLDLEPTRVQNTPPHIQRMLLAVTRKINQQRAHLWTWARAKPTRSPSFQSHTHTLMRLKYGANYFYRLQVIKCSALERPSHPRSAVAASTFAIGQCVFGQSTRAACGCTHTVLCDATASRDSFIFGGALCNGRNRSMV